MKTKNCVKHIEDNFSSSKTWGQIKQTIKEAKEFREIEIKAAFLAGCEMGEMHNNENRCYETDAVEYLKEKTE